jgi:AraC-like DNA-binding protein
MFESRGGVARHLLRLRLGLVHRDLANPFFASRPIGKLAEARGLHNITSFNRAFRREFGCTPGDARAAALLGAPLPPLNGGWRGSGGCPSFIDLLA